QVIHNFAQTIFPKSERGNPESALLGQCGPVAINRPGPAELFRAAKKVEARPTWSNTSLAVLPGSLSKETIELFAAAIKPFAVVGSGKKLQFIHEPIPYRLWRPLSIACSAWADCLTMRSPCARPAAKDGSLIPFRGVVAPPG